jgi:alpha-galactosidase
MPRNALFSIRTDWEEEALDFASPIWEEAPWAEIERLWSGALPFRESAAVSSEIEAAPGPSADRDSRHGASGNRTRVASCWTTQALFLRFSCRFTELNVAERLGVGGPIPQLWEHDVVEAFLRPAGSREYFEIEVSPLGQWLDLRVIQPRRDVDWRWRSQLSLRVDLDREAGRWETVVRLPYGPLKTNGQAAAPGVGEVWRANFFRIAGVEPSRLHFCWRPTFTPTPDFHVPDAFGNLMFLSREVLA